MRLKSSPTKLFAATGSMFAGLVSSLSMAAAAPTGQSAPISAAAGRISADIRVLSSDDFEGRGPATAGEGKTVDFLERRFKSLGLQPAGDGGGWTQAVHLNTFETRNIAMTVSSPTGVTPLRQGPDAVVSTRIPVTKVAVHDAPIVFVGYGVNAPEKGWDDYKGVDLHGKIALVLVNDPDFEAEPGDDAYGQFDGKAITYYGRWTYKYEEAARRGAAGVLIIHEAKGAGYGWETVKNSFISKVFDIERADPSSAHPLIEGWVQAAKAEELLRASGLDLERLKQSARSRSFQAIVLQGQRFTADYDVDLAKVTSSTVLARLPGTERPEETLVYSAHWDHYGIGAPDAKGDRIYNGAVDNGAGVAAMLEIARTWAAGPKPQRSVLFAAFTAEEPGMLGAYYYAAHPTIPLKTIVADLNLDILAPDGLARDVSEAGVGKVSLEDDIASAAATQGRRFTPDQHPEEGHFFRRDSFPFAKSGVPAFTLSSGEDLYDGGVAAGEAWRTDYFANHYHQPSDEWKATWNLDGIALDAQLYYVVGTNLANSRRWPAWSASSEFARIKR